MTPLLFEGQSQTTPLPTLSEGCWASRTPQLVELACNTHNNFRNDIFCLNTYSYTVGAQVAVE